MKNLYIFFLSLLMFATSSRAKDLEKNGSIKGTVTTSDGQPAAYVSVGIKGSNKGATTHADGTYLIGGVKPGTYTVKVSYVGLQTQELQVTVKDGAQTVQNFVLTEDASKLREVEIAGNRSPNMKAVTVGKSGIAARDLPQAVRILDSAIITDQQANRMADVIKNVNGVSMGENRGSVNETFFARGYSLGANNVLKNGARTTIGGSPEASTLESVEVLKGSAALMYGGVTGGAVINMVTKKPKFYYGGEVSMRAGSYSQYKPIVDVYGPIAKNVAFRAIATKENAKSFRDVVKTDRFYVNPSLLFNISPKTELIVQGDYLSSNYTPDFGLGTVKGMIPDIGRNAFVNVSWAYNHTRTGTAQANLTHKFNDNWKLNVIGAFQSYSRDYFGAERPQQPTDKKAVRALTRSHTQEYTYNQQVTVTGTVMTGGIKHTLMIGGDADESLSRANAYKYGDGTNAPTTMNADSVNLLDPATYATSLDIPYTRIYQTTTAPIYRMGGFVQDLISLTDHFKVLAGLRYTYQRTPRSSIYNQDLNTTTLNTSSGIPGNKIDRAFSPKFGFIYQPIKTTSVYVSYANNFTTNTGVDINGSPMGASIIDQYEAGIKNEFWDGKMTLNVTAYRIANDRFAQVAALKADGSTNGDTNVKEFSGATKSDGIEVDITGKISKGLYFIAGYTYNYFRYTKTLPTGITEGERIIGSTPHTANGTVFYTFDRGAVKGLKVGASAFYTGRRNMGFNTPKTGAARGAVVNVTDFATIDLSAGYSIKKVSLLAKLSNITDELNYTVHENYSVNPIPPRMLSATLSYKF